MELKINNARPLLVADTTNAGAAVKIIFHGGSALNIQAQEKVSGLSPFLWQTRRKVVRDLVKELEAAE